MSAMDAAFERIARETQIAFRQCHEMAVQRLLDSAWLYRDAAQRALGVNVNESWELSDAEIRERALKIVESERKRITHHSHNRPRYLACLELAEAAQRKITMVTQKGAA